MTRMYGLLSQACGSLAVALAVLGLVAGSGRTAFADPLPGPDACACACDPDDQQCLDQCQQQCLAAKCDDTCNPGTVGYVSPIGVPIPCGDHSGDCKKLNPNDPSYTCNPCDFSVLKDQNGNPSACQAVCASKTVKP